MSRKIPLAALGALVLAGCSGSQQPPPEEVNFPPSARSSAPINENWPSTTPGGEATHSGGALPSAPVTTAAAPAKEKAGH